MKITICELKFFFSHCITHTHRHSNIYFFVTEAEIVCILFWCSYSLHFYEFLSQTWQYLSAIYTYSAANMLGLPIRNNSTPSYSGFTLKEKMQLEFDVQVMEKPPCLHKIPHVTNSDSNPTSLIYVWERERDTCRCIREGGIMLTADLFHAKALFTFVYSTD